MSERLRKLLLIISITAAVICAAVIVLFVITAQRDKHPLSWTNLSAVYGFFPASAKYCDSVRPAGQKLAHLYEFLSNSLLKLVHYRKIWHFPEKIRTLPQDLSSIRGASELDLPQLPFSVF